MFADPNAPLTHRPTARLLVARRRHHNYGEDDAQHIMVGTFTRDLLSPQMIAAARRLQQQVFVPDPARPGHFRTDKACTKLVARALSP
eukprot:SAG31_NODE_972_length_10644_cov_3.435372_8_plen_88_part_00